MTLPIILKKNGGKSRSEIRVLVAIEGAVLAISREYFSNKGFLEVTIPHITKATGSCENMDTVFDLDYFGHRAYLLQTGQLFLELLTPILGRVWCYGPSFRAEPKVDKRHLTEFGLVEMEFCGSFEQLLSHMENLISAIVTQMLRLRLKELEVLNVNYHELQKIRPPFKRVTYEQATKILGITWGKDLKRQQEAILVEKFGGKPLIITHHPERMKFFNMKTNDNDPRVVNSADLILPFSGEAIGAAERETEYEKVYQKLEKSTTLKQLQKRGGSIKDFMWYLNHLKQGSLPHSGFGMGVNRVTQFLLGRNDIRMSTTFALNRQTVM